MKLSDFIRANIAPILDAWEEFAQGIPVARGMDMAALRDHARGMLYTIADDLDRSETPFEQEEKSKGPAPRTAQQTYAALHGVSRETAGFSVNEAVSEFRALRARILKLWADSDTRQPDVARQELTRFNEAIDQALAESLDRYSTDLVRYTRLFATLLSSSPDLSYIFDADGRFIYANHSLSRLCGMSEADLIGKNLVDLGAANAAILQQQLQEVVTAKATYRGEIVTSLCPQKEVTFEYIFIPVMNDEGSVEAVVGTGRDITERKMAEEKTMRSANYDALTGLPNRSLFRDQLAREVKRSTRTGLPIALFFIDLDGFKEVNDRMGHDAGDQLLQQVAQRISACVRGTDTVARIGGDEFTVILTAVNKILHVEILAREIVDELAKPLLILDTEVNISASIGVTLFPQDAATPEDLIKNADQAMYVAKKAGRSRFNFFTAAMQKSAWARIEILDALRYALPRHQLTVHYQPIIDLSSGRIVKAEALLRWQHPQNGLVLPDEFIGLAEETGLIGDIDEWVLSEALICARAWSVMLGEPFQISVNQSPVEFTCKEPMKMLDTLVARLTALRMPRNSISVEITEGVLLNDSPTVVEKLENLKKAGVQLGVDTFGSGFSSMVHLKKYQVNYLKIDSSFVQGMGSDADSRTIAESIIVMAHKLGLEVIAEGVETAEQRDWLTSSECDYAQGYLFSKAVAAPDFERLLEMDRFEHQMSQRQVSQHPTPHH